MEYTSIYYLINSVERNIYNFQIQIFQFEKRLMIMMDHGGTLYKNIYIPPVAIQVYSGDFSK